jgi:phosphoribosyl 1,2-cyclic phosphodiesterase
MKVFLLCVSASKNIHLAPSQTFQPYSVLSGFGVFLGKSGGAIVKFCVLASGSSGNAALLSTGKTRILVDAGLSMRETGKRLAAIGESLANIDAILITHEHCDHVAGLPALARNGKEVHAAIYVTQSTGSAIDWGKNKPHLEAFQAGARFCVGDIEVQSFSVPHDAADPVGFCFEAEGIRIGIATDLGFIPENIKFHLRRTHVLLLEANHDLDMLKVGPYPWSVKQRVMSRTGHLSNRAMSDFLEQDLDSGTAHVILGHLSEHNNHPAIAQVFASQALEARGHPARLTIAEQGNVSEVFQF